MQRLFNLFGMYLERKIKWYLKKKSEYKQITFLRESVNNVTNSVAKLKFQNSTELKEYLFASNDTFIKIYSIILYAVRNDMGKLTYIIIHYIFIIKMLMYYIILKHFSCFLT